MKEFLKKYGSRKYLIAMLTNILCIVTALSGYGGKVGLVASIIAIVTTTAIYIVNERKIDVEAVQKIIQLTVEDYEQIKDLIENYKIESDTELESEKEVIKE